MGFETLKEERKIEILPEHKFRIKLEQEDVYDAINIVNMVEGWKKKRDDSVNFLATFDDVKDAAIAEAERRLEAMKESHMERIKSNELSIALWEPSLNEWVKKNPRKYEQVINEIRESQKKKE